MNIFIRTCLLSILFFGVLETGIAQKEHRKRARKAIKELNEGVLIVSIPTFQKKIDTLKHLLKQDISEREEAFLNSELEKTEKYRNIAPQQIQEAFGVNYNFSRVLFMYDTSSIYLRKGNYNNIFLNENTNTNLEEENFFILKPGVLRTSNRYKNAIIVDKHFTPLEPPFPNIKYKKKNNSTFFPDALSIQIMSLL